MEENLFKINKLLILKKIKIHLYYIVLDNFDNNPLNYNYQNSIIEPETKKIWENYTIDNVKDNPIIAAYRKFYWQHLKIDPTKIRPSGEALVRRLLQGKKLPKINYFVDGYNWASAVSLIPIGAYDMDTYNGSIELRFAHKNEKFLAIGGKERVMKGNELITVDKEGLILSQFPYRDADSTKVTKNTKKIIITSLGVENVPKEAVKQGLELTIDFLKRCELPNEPNFTISTMEYLSNY